MTIRTFDELPDSFAGELAWRKKELSDLKYFIDQNSLCSSRKQVLARCGIAILYAHWEGFIKICSGNFLEYIALCRDIKTGSLK